MLTCTFFGHKDTPKEIEPILRSALVDLIENKNVLKFYVGNNGSFDHMVKRGLYLASAVCYYFFKSISQYSSMVMTLSFIRNVYVPSSRDIILRALPAITV